ncbi:MAG TPA: alpha/beta hydrolase [Ktedonobacterales bacterium]|jgi:acetyl esterase/lipase
MQMFRSFYRQHQISVKLGGFLGFIVVIASLYFFVLSGSIFGNAAADATGQGSPTQIGPENSPISTAALPTLPPEPSPSPIPPLLPPRYHVTMHPNLAYATSGAVDRRLDLCEPVGAPGLRPGVILIHDIGTKVEDKSVYTSLCSLLASQGFVAAAINYRKYPNVWPAQLEDAQLSVRWLRANAGKYKLDPTRLCSWGDSAGAHLAVFLGVLGTSYPGDESGLLSNQSPRVSCVVDDFGYVDLTTLPNTAFWQGAFGFMFGQDADGKSVATPALLHKASPIFYVDAQSAPMLLVHGALDVVVSPGQSRELQQKLQQATVPVSYMSYAGGHDFSGVAPQQLNAIKRQIISYLTAQEHP